MDNQEKLLFAVLAVPLAMGPVLLVDVYDLPKAVTLLIVAGLIAASAIWRWRAASAIRLGRFDLLILVLLGSLAISTIFSINPAQSLTGFYKRREGLVSWFAYATIYFATRRASGSPGFTDRLMSALVGFSIPISFYAVLQRFGVDPLSFAGADPARSFSTTGNPVYLGAYLVLVLPFSIVYLYSAREWGRRILGLSACGLGAAALLSSYTRAAWLASIPGLAFLVIWLLLRSDGAKRAVVLAVTAAALILGLFFSAGVAGRVVSGFSTGTGAVATRLETWRITPRLIMMRPVTGWGLETFQSAFMPYRSKRFVELEGARSALNRPHNQALYLGYAAGLPGLALYLLLIGFSLKYAFVRFREADDLSKPFYLAALLSIGGYWLQEQFSFSSVGVTPVLWLLLGVVAAKSRRPWVIRLPNPRPAARNLLVIAGSLLIMLPVIVSIVFLFGDYQYRRALSSPNPVEAASSLESAVRLNPLENTYRLTLAQAYLSSGLANAYGPYFQKAVFLTEQASARDPWDPTPYRLTAEAIRAGYARGLWQESDLARADKAYRRAIYLDPYLETQPAGSQP